MASHRQSDQSVLDYEKYLILESSDSSEFTETDISTQVDESSNQLGRHLNKRKSVPEKAMSQVSNRKQSLATPTASRSLPQADRNTSLSWTDIIKLAEDNGNNTQFINSEEAPSGLTSDTVIASEGKDRSKKSPQGTSSPRPSRLSSPTRGGSAGAEQSRNHLDALRGRTVSHKVDTWREKSPKSKRKEWEIQKTESQQREAVPVSPTKTQGSGQHVSGFSKDTESGVFTPQLSPLDATRPSISPSTSLEQNVGRPPSPSSERKTEILPKVDTWRGERSPTARRRKLILQQATMSDANVGTNSDIYLEQDNCIGIQACSLDFLVSVEAEVKPEPPSSPPPPKKIVMPKVDTRWKDGIPRRTPEAVGGFKNAQVDTDSFSPTTELKFIYAHRERKLLSDTDDSMDASASNRSSSPPSPAPACHNIETNVYIPKRKSSAPEPAPLQERQHASPLVVQTRIRTENSGASRPASPVPRKLPPDSAIITTPSSPPAKDASVVDEQPPGSPRQSMQSQRIKAAALSAGKHVLEYEGLIRQYEEALADEKDGLKENKTNGLAALPYQVSMPYSLSTMVYSTKVPMVILLVYILLVLQLLTGDSALRHREGCHQIESSYSNSGAVYCRN